MRAFSFPWVAVGVLCTVLLSGCAGTNTESPSVQEISSVPAQAGPEGDVVSSAPAGSTSGVDPVDGGRCVDGEDVVVRGDALSPVVTGMCGRVLLEGVGITARIDSARSVEVLGEDHHVSGGPWGGLTVEGQRTTVDGDVSGTVDVAGTEFALTVTQPSQVTIRGEGTTLSADEVTRLEVFGIDHTITAGTVAEVEVRGHNNTLTWSEGPKKAQVNEGDNKAVRTQ